MSTRARSAQAFFLAALTAWTLVACMRQSLQEGDREALLQIGQLAPYGLELPSGYREYETFGRERWFDGSIGLEYEFEAPDELALPYLYSSAEKHPSSTDACLSHTAGNFGALLGGMELSERNEAFARGDKSRFGVLVDEGTPYGNFFSMCRGKTAFLFIVGGFYSEDGDLWAEILEPVLEGVEGIR